MLRLPKARVDLRVLARYLGQGAGSPVRKVGAYVVLDFLSDTEDPDGKVDGHSLAALAPLRAELLGGDLRPAYLAWLRTISDDDVDEDALEPPVPGGLGQLSAAQEAMIAASPTCSRRSAGCSARPADALDVCRERAPGVIRQGRRRENDAGRRPPPASETVAVLGALGVKISPARRGGHLRAEVSAE